jgi:hypothetical protein
MAVQKKVNFWNKNRNDIFSLPFFAHLCFLSQIVYKFAVFIVDDEHENMKK